MVLEIVLVAEAVTTLITSIEALDVIVPEAELSVATSALMLVVEVIDAEASAK